MAVGLKVRSNVWLLGTGDFFFAFFSTVRARLEPEGWGTRFPVVMKELYAGEVAPESASRAVAELEQIGAELRGLPASALVWDAEDPAKRPLPRDLLPPDASDAAGWFARPDGPGLIDLLTEGIGYAARAGVPAVVKSSEVYERLLRSPSPPSVAATHEEHGEAAWRTPSEQLPP